MEDNIVLLCYSNKDEKVSLEFSPCRKTKDIMWEDWNYCEHLIVNKTDYINLLVKYIEKIFPLYDPENNDIEEYFDVCSTTWIGKSDWVKLIKIIEDELEIRIIEKEKIFYEKFINWIIEQLKNVEIIVVTGNQ